MFQAKKADKGSGYPGNSSQWELSVQGRDYLEFLCLVVLETLGDLPLEEICGKRRSRRCRTDSLFCLSFLNTPSVTRG